jgi:hypothetical protein
VTHLDVEYSGVLGIDILRLMEAKVDLCSSDLIIGRSRYELTGLNCHDRGSPQVTITQPVAECEWRASDLINPAGPMGNEKATEEKGAGRLASLVRRELNPGSPVEHIDSQNILSIVLAQMVMLPPRSRVVAMGRMSRDRQRLGLPQSIVVDPVPPRMSLEQ